MARTRKPTKASLDSLWRIIGRLEEWQHRQDVFDRVQHESVNKAKGLLLDFHNRLEEERK